MRSVISHGCRQGFALDHDDFGFIQSKIIVIESKSSQRDAGGKPGSIFPHPALAHFSDARRNAPRRETHRPANWRMAPIRPGKYGEIGFTRRNFSPAKLAGLHGSGRDPLLIPHA
jgi:hypothetical protein